MAKLLERHQALPAEAVYVKFPTVYDFLSPPKPEPYKVTLIYQDRVAYREFDRGREASDWYRPKIMLLANMVLD